MSTSNNSFDLGESSFEGKSTNDEMVVGARQRHEETKETPTSYWMTRRLTDEDRDLIYIHSFSTCSCFSCCARRAATSSGGRSLTEDENASSCSKSEQEESKFQHIFNS